MTILVMFSLTSCRQKTETVPVDFIETTPPKNGSPDWYSLNYSNNEFCVTTNNGQIAINKVENVSHKGPS